MSDGWSAAAQSLGRMGGTLVESALTINEIDARQKSDAAELEIASRIEAFKRGLLSDPDHGTPGQQDGYMAKWKDEVAGIDEMIQGIDNPLARRAVQSSFSRIAANQTTAVYSLQHQAWGKATVAQRLDMIRQRAETSGLPVQDQLNLAAEDLDFLVGSNLLDRYERDKQLSDWSQVIMERDLSARAKAAYALGGLPAAKKLLLDDSEIYTAGGSPYRASDTVKASAVATIEALDAIVNDEADADMETAWARMVAAERYGTNPQGPILTVDYVQGWRTKDGYAPDAKTKEYWIARLESFSNGKDSGSGTAAAQTAKLWIGQAEKVVGALRRTKGGVLAADAAVQVVNPVTGKLIARGINRDVLSALGKNPEFVQAMDASGAWNEWNALLDSLDKPMGAGETLRKEIEKKLEGKPGKAALLAEFDAYVSGAGAEASPEKLQAFVNEKITGKAYDVQVGQLFDGSWTGNRYKDGVDLFAQDLMDGRFADLVVRDETGRGKITNPLYAPAYNRALADVQSGLARLGIPTTAPAILDGGNPWFVGNPKDVKDAPKERQATDAEKRALRGDPEAAGAVPLGQPAGVAYSLVPVTNNRDARYFRDLTYQDGYHARQVYEVVQGKGLWVDVVPAATGKGGYWTYADPAIIEQLMKGQQGPAYQGYLDAAGRAGAGQSEFIRSLQKK